MGLTKDRLVFDASDVASSDQVASFLYASDGTALAHTGGDLHVNVQNASLTVTATDLDIRDLSASQDNVAISDGTDVLDIVTVDAIAAGSENGPFILGLRQDAAGSPVSADGDYHPFIFNNDGELKVAADIRSEVADDAADSGNPVKVGSRAFDGALSAVSASNDRADLLSDLYRRIWVNDAPNIATANTAETVGVTAAELVSTPLAGRKHIFVQNLGNKEIYVGADNTVTTSNGLRIASGGTLDLAWGEDIDLWAISDSAGQDVRVLEVA